MIGTLNDVHDGSNDGQFDVPETCGDTTKDMSATPTSDDYFLRVGNNDLLTAALLADLASLEPDTQKKAAELLAQKLKETRVRVGTLLKTDNVSFLIGAGASIAAGGVGLATIPIALEESLIKAVGTLADTTWINLFYATVSLLTGDKTDYPAREKLLAKNPKTAKPLAINVEDYLSHLHMWRSAIVNPATLLTLHLDDKQSISLPKKALDTLIAHLNVALAQLVDLPIKGKEAEAHHHRRFLKKLLTRPLNLRRANLFTLNYDTLIEQAADGEGAVLVDGFVGNIKRIFRPESYDLDFYFPAQTTEGRVHRFDRAFHLYKLHGSLTWHRCEADWNNPYGLYSTFFDQSAPDADVLIYPSPLKYGQSLGMPYSELFRRFANSIAQPQSVLFVIGYGFGDDHVNSLIRQALAIPSFTLVIVDPDPRSTFVEQLKTQGDERIWFISGWKLGKFEIFVEKLLPDLREEEISKKVMQTYDALAHGRIKESKGGGEDNE